MAVWFAGTAPPKTVVWSANGDSPVGPAAELVLTTDGQFALTNGAIGRPTWQPAGVAASSVSLLDTGNLVVFAADYAVLWQSFAFPTDTMVPAQVLNQSTFLQSRLADSGYSKGRFQLLNSEDGDLVFLAVNAATGYEYAVYEHTATAGNDTQLVFDPAGLLYFDVKNGSTISFPPQVELPTDDFYQRMTLDSDGALRHGAGCATDQANLYDFVEMVDTDWPFSVYDYDVYYPIDEARCKDYCLRDCFCGAAVYRDGYCRKKKLPLSNGRSASYVGGKTLLKVPRNNNSYMFSPSPLDTSTSTSTIVAEKEESELILAGSLLIGISGFLNAVFIGAITLAICCYRNRQKNQKLTPTDPTISGLNLRVFSYRELEEATNAFRDELGSGAFGTVYKGILASESNTVIAVKRLHNLALRESENEFTNEVRAIGRTHHKNLVRLFGFCNEGTHRLLVYEYMSNGSLTSLLFGPEKPSWSKRVRIASEIARGLLYLHDECSAQIIHCDIKPQNILLDDNSVARIADFGLAKLLKDDQTRTSTLCIRGTRGYVTPEWFRNTAITAKVDVYSFGVVLLEIICCRRSIEIDIAENEAVLAHWAYECLKDDKLDLLLESDEAAVADMSRLSRFIAVAIWCTQEDPSLRLSMQKAIQMLEGLAAVALPAESVRF